MEAKIMTVKYIETIRQNGEWAPQTDANAELIERLFNIEYPVLLGEFLGEYEICQTLDHKYRD